MANYTQQLIGFIEQNQISTEEVSDALGKTGVLKDIKPIQGQMYSVGEVQYVYGFNNSNWMIHEQIQSVDEDKIVFVDGIQIYERALFGQLVSRYLFDKKGARAIIASGYMRDLQGLVEDHARVWCKGITPIGCYNKKMDIPPQILTMAEQRRNYYDGSIAVCDNSGVIIIQKEQVTKEFIGQLEKIHDQEKVWFEYVLNRNRSTYDVVCLKKYLSEE